jgi:hypothetical protein
MQGRKRRGSCGRTIGRFPGLSGCSVSPVSESFGVNVVLANNPSGYTNCAQIFLTCARRVQAAANWTDDSQH